MRQVQEWIGKTDDSPPPPRIRLAVFVAADRRCQLCTRKIGAGGEKWQADHIKALINGGENRQTNLQALCLECHRRKTGFDVAEKSKSYKRRLSNAGVKRRRRTIPGRKFDGTPIQSKWVVK